MKERYKYINRVGTRISIIGVLSLILACFGCAHLIHSETFSFFAVAPFLLLGVISPWLIALGFYTKWYYKPGGVYEREHTKRNK